MVNGDLLADLGAFLRNPVIRLTVSDEVEELRSQLTSLQRDYDDLKDQHLQVTNNYRDLTMYCLNLKDLLRENGIKIR